KLQYPLKTGGGLHILGLDIAGGENPKTDEYEVTYTLPRGKISAVKLDALRHPSMTAGGLARSDSGNFVLTNLSLDLLSEDGTRTPLSIAKARATFEQGGHKVTNTLDNDPKSGWAVWNGKKVDRDHSAVFELKEAVQVSKQTRLKVKLEFNSVHASHHMGQFRLSASSKAEAPLEDAAQDLQLAIRTAKDKRTEKQRALIAAAFFESDTKLAELQKREANQKKSLDGLKKSLPKVMVLKDQDKRRSTFILTRGLYNQKGDEVTARTPQFLHGLADAGADESASPRRLELANWLVSRDNPLTARVTVNRFWQMLFGMGLVKTTEDFGVQAEYPIQPELLDWLAVEFIESGWDVKHLLTLILTSEAYQRSSSIATPEVLQQDPDNRYFARGPRYRLPSWMLHDQALAIAGLLNREQGGPSVFPYQPEGIWKEATFGKKSYRVGGEQELYRRSLYTYWRRIIGPTMFFDTAKRQVCEVKPLRTNTPMHALTTLNEFAYVESAKALARLCMSCDDQDASRLQWMSKRVLCRELSEEEAAIWQRSLERAKAYYGSHSDEAKLLLKDSPLPENTTPEELAAWTSICLNALNLDETLSKE
ncbi:MAG: DUF1553 domain-containing protein, partial [Planctomycetota bacterium]